MAVRSNHNPTDFLDEEDENKLVYIESGIMPTGLAEIDMEIALDSHVYSRKVGEIQSLKRPNIAIKR